MTRYLLVSYYDIIFHAFSNIFHLGRNRNPWWRGLPRRVPRRRRRRSRGSPRRSWRAVNFKFLIEILLFCYFFKNSRENYQTQATFHSHDQTHIWEIAISRVSFTRLSRKIQFTLILLQKMAKMWWFLVTLASYREKTLQKRYPYNQRYYIILKISRIIRWKNTGSASFLHFEPKLV